MRTAGTVAGGTIVNVRAFEVPPPGDPFTTVTCAVPTVAMSFAETAVVSVVELSTVAGRTTPFQFTADWDQTKPVPVMVSKKPKDPAGADDGDNEVMVGGVFPMG
jgi:hypothetical protein